MPTPITNTSLNFQALELRFSQLQRATDKSRSGKYSDPKKQEFHDSIVAVVNAISKQDFSRLTVEDLGNTQIIVERLFKWLEFLVNSTINQTPYEIISCLEEVLNDWVDDRDSYLLLTSLSNNKDFFAFEYERQPGLLKKAKEYIHRCYGIDIKHDIIRIILPRFLSHDYFTAVSLYHEIAHFIDGKYWITDDIIYNRGLKDEDSIRAAYQEYFADLFAAQYVKQTSCSHIAYLTHDKPIPKYHPPTQKRITMVQSFLAGKKPSGDMGEIYVDIKNAVKRLTGRQLKRRYKEVSEKDFNKLVPVNLTTSTELHGLFIKIWEIWLNPKSRLRKQFPNRYELYRILNNLVEKSISNFFLTKSWNKSNVPD